MLVCFVSSRDRSNMSGVAAIWVREEAVEARASC